MAQPEDLLEISSDDTGLVVRGEIDAHTAPGLADAIELARGEGGDVTIDLAGVQFVDSSGLRVLITAHQQTTAKGGQLRLVSPSDAVRRLFEISGVDEYLNVD